MAKILVVSDTHGDDTWLSLLKDCQYDYIIHAGDHLMPDQISNITPYFVDGNNDWGHQTIKVFDLENQRFVLVHGDEQGVRKSDLAHLADRFSGLIQQYHPAILVYGHTHIPFVGQSQGTIILNPGSMSFSRHNGQKCYLELELNQDGILNVSQLTYPSH